MRLGPHDSEGQRNARLARKTMDASASSDHELRADSRKASELLNQYQHAIERTRTDAQGTRSSRYRGCRCKAARTRGPGASGEKTVHTEPVPLQRDVPETRDRPRHQPGPRAVSGSSRSRRGLSGSASAGERRGGTGRGARRVGRAVGRKRRTPVVSPVGPDGAYGDGTRGAPCISTSTLPRVDCRRASGRRRVSQQHEIETLLANRLTNLNYSIPVVPIYLSISRIAVVTLLR